MGKKLFISEKPSVAASFASVLGLQIQKNDRAKGYMESDDTIVTWCFGHLVTMAFPDAYDQRYKEWKGEEDLTDSPIHQLMKNEKSVVKGFELEEKETKPPSRYTDGSLIITMEKAGKFIENEELREQIKTCGIGTSATRSGIIKKLKDIGYININHKTQIVTPAQKGEEIIAIVRSTAKELLDPALSASWEKGLAMIENKETTEEVFQEKLYKYIKKTISKVKKTLILD